MSTWAESSPPPRSLQEHSAPLWALRGWCHLCQLASYPDPKTPGDVGQSLPLPGGRRRRRFLTPHGLALGWAPGLPHTKPPRGEVFVPVLQGDE